MGKNSFQDIMQITSTSNEDLWKQVKYVIFDAPDHKAMYEERMKFLTEAKIKFPSHAFVAPSTKCTGQTHLNEYMQNILQEGGEGVMLRRPQSLYEPGRSKSLYKFKVRSLWRLYCIGYSISTL
jgi:DNA ligase-1